MNKKAKTEKKPRNLQPFKVSQSWKIIWFQIFQVHLNFTCEQMNKKTYVIEFIILFQSRFKKIRNRFPNCLERHLVRIKMNTLVICEGPVFGPVQKLNEIVTWRICMLSRSWIYPNFHPKLMITWSKIAFGSCSNCSKAHFWSSSNKWRWPKTFGQNWVLKQFVDWPKSGFDRVINFEKKIRVDQMWDIMNLCHVSHRVTWLPHPISELDRKLDPCVVKRWDFV